MNQLLHKLKRLKGFGADELRVRAGQFVAARSERLGMGARLPTDAGLASLIDDAPRGPERKDAASLLEHFRRAPRPFFAAFHDPLATCEALRRLFASENEAAILARARRVAEGRFDLLGFRDLSFGDPIDWNFEPMAGKRAPLTHWSRISELDGDTTGDKKIIWELNRHQHFFTLGRAYWYTGDEQHARVFTAHLASWMSAHPTKGGVNWMSSLEVAFRAISWLWALHFFKHSPHLAPELFARALKYLYLHGRHIETYLSTYFSPNTHLTGEALGLYYLGTVLPELRCAARWREKGRSILLEQLARQVGADGVYFEQASYYQRYTADFYAHFLLLARAAGESLDAKLGPWLTALSDHLMHIAAPDGITPFYGDDDGGRLAPLDEHAAADFRATLSTAAAVFARPDYKHAAGRVAEDTLWLTGRGGVESFDALNARPPDETSRAFKLGGYYVMRDGWTRDANYLLIDCGPHGAEGGGHAHADALSIVLAARGRTLLVDPGTYSYTGSREMREYFRHSAAHNTLVVDGESSSITAGPFRWSHTARCVAREWLARARFDFFEGAHDGYARLLDPVTHRRSVLFIKGDYFIVRDAAEGRARHRAELYFHLARGADPRIEGEGSEAHVGIGACEAGAGLDLHVHGAAGNWRLEEGWISPCYGERMRAPVCVFAAEGEGVQEFVTVVVPRAGGEERTRVASLEPGGAPHFLEIAGRDVQDYLLLGRAGELVAEQRFVTDFAWTWARAAPDGTLREVILIGGGRRFAYAGCEVLVAPNALRYASVRLLEGELHLEAAAADGDTHVGELIVDGVAFGLQC